MLLKFGAFLILGTLAISQASRQRSAQIDRGVHNPWHFYDGNGFGNENPVPDEWSSVSGSPWLGQGGLAGWQQGNGQLGDQGGWQHGNGQGWRPQSNGQIGQGWPQGNGQLGGQGGWQQGNGQGWQQPNGQLGQGWQQDFDSWFRPSKATQRPSSNDDDNQPEESPFFNKWPTFPPSWGSGSWIIGGSGSSSSTRRPRPGWSRPTRRPTPIRPTQAPPSTNPDEDNGPSESSSGIGCGKQATGLQPQISRNPTLPNRGINRVINGNDAKPHSWPWVIAFLNNGRVQCGGSLLRVKDGVEATDIVLTAAHCVTRMNTLNSGTPQPVPATGLTIAAGLHKYNEQSKYAQRSRGQTIMINPNFREQSGTIVNDIALVKLATPIKFTDGVRPVCLPRQGAALPTQQTCVAAGWGRNNSQHMFQSAEPLQQVIAPVHPAQTCTRGWGGMYKENAMVCAGELNGESGVCNGDSGSTLMCKEDDRWVQHGVVSFGVPGDCLEQNKPDVYARVSSYVDWIKKGIDQMTSL